VADDGNGHVATATMPEKIRYTVKEPGFGHARAIDLRLQTAPVVFAVGTGAQGITQRLLALIQRHLRPATPPRRLREQVVIAGKGIIEIDADTPDWIT